MGEQAAGKGSSSQEITLVKALRPFHVWALGVGIVLVGEFMGWNFTIAKGGTLASLLACWFAGTLYITLVLITGELGSCISKVGGPYDWVRVTVGPGAAWIVGVAVMMEYLCLEAGDAIVTAFTLKEFFPELEVFPLTLLLVAILTFLNYRGVVLTLTFNFIITFTAFLTIIALFISWVCGVYPMHPELRAEAALPFGLVGLFAALQFGPWYYLGIEGAAMAAEETRKPGRDVPLGQQAGMITLLIAAALTWFLCTGLVPAEKLGASAYPLLDAALATGNFGLIVALAIGTLFSCMASANGCICDTSRSWFALSREGFFTTWFADVHPKYRSPYRTVLFTLPIAIALAFSGLLDQVITFSIISGLVCYIFIPLALIRFRKLWPTGEIHRPYVCPMHKAVAFTAIAFTYIIMLSLYFGYFINMLAAILFYVVIYLYFALYRIKRITAKIGWEEYGWPAPKE